MSNLSRRLLHHVGLALASSGIGFLLYAIVSSPDPRFRWSMSSAYTGLALLVLTLAIGPVNTLRGRRTPISSDFRRDVGIWSGLWSVLHTVIGLQMHLRGMMSQYFLYPGQTHWFNRIRTDLFGAANYTGLLAVALVILLTLLSNDLSLRRLGASRWKRFQQLNYLCFAAATIHGILYQVIEKRIPLYVFALGFMAAVAVTLQAARAVTRTPAQIDKL